MDQMMVTDYKMPENVLYRSASRRVRYDQLASGDYYLGWWAKCGSRNHDRKWLTRAKPVSVAHRKVVSSRRALKAQLEHAH